MRYATLQEALAAHGFDPAAVPSRLQPGKLERFPAPGKHRSNRSAWIVLHRDGGGATFGTHTEGDWKYTWREGSDRPELQLRDLRPQSAVHQDEKRAADAAAAVRQAQWLWDKAKPAEECDPHPYAIRKGVSVAGLRVNSGRLLVPMRAELSGPIVALQFIDRDGVKRFGKGTTKDGAFFLIPGEGPPIIAEGYATGATVAAATGRPVAVAFDAGNLIKVAQKFACDGAAIAADNDNRVKARDSFRHKPEQMGTGHRAAIKAGLPFYLPPAGCDFNDIGIEATQAIFAADPVSSVPVFDAWALQRVELQNNRESDLARALASVLEPVEAAVMAWTVASRLSMRCPAQISMGHIREFLDRHLPPLSVHPSTLDGIVKRIATAQKHRKTAALSAVTIPDDIKRRHRLERHSALPQIGPHDWQGVIVVQAPMGEGKTQKIGQPFANWARAQGKFLAICHRVSLVSELAQRLQIKHYGDLPAEVAWATDGLATCLPSITLLEHAAFIERAQYIFVDEVAQVLRFLDADKHCRTKAASNAVVWAKLKEVISKARCVVVADAGIDGRVIKFLEECRPGEQFRLIEVSAPVSNGIEAVYSCGGNGPAAVVGEALVELSIGGRVWLAVESQRRVLELGRFFSEKGYRTLVLTAGNKGEEAAAAFMEEPEAQSRLYDIVIASPVISSGLSIEHREGAHFTLGGFIGSGKSITPADAAQMLRRVRYMKRFVLGLLANNDVGGQNPEAIIMSWEAAAKIEESPAEVTSFDRLRAGIRADEQNARADFAAGLLWQLDAAGWELRQSQNDADDEVAEALRLVSEDERARHRAALLEARVLTADEARVIERKPARTSVETLMLEAHRIRHELNVQTLTEEVLDFWDGGAAVPRLDRFSAARGVIPARSEKDATLSQRRYWQACARAYADLLGGTDITTQHFLNDATASQIMERVLRDRHVLARLGIVGAEYSRWDEDRDGRLLPMKPRAYPVRDVAKMLARIGLELKGCRVRRRSTSPRLSFSNSGACGTPDATKGGELFRLYSVTPESLTRMVEASGRRNLTRAMAELKPQSSTLSNVIPLFCDGVFDLNLAQTGRERAPHGATADIAARVKQSDEERAATAWIKGEFSRLRVRLTARPTAPLLTIAPDQEMHPAAITDAERRRERALRSSRVARMRGPQVTIWAAE